MNKFRILGSGVPYLDGAENRILEIMQATEDRSVGSDELALQIVDWPTKYHLSRARTNLFLPFRISESMSVLDVGCGTGALTRYFAEIGCQITGLEGSYQRSLAALERVREFDNAEIVNGSLDEYASLETNRKFDVVILSGVLEYSGDGTGGQHGPEKMLSTVKLLLKETGVLILAIENQLGLKYLAGYNEDHLGKPLVGLLNYLTEETGIRTWTKSSLQGLLTKSGFDYQSWFYPFPDYKIPEVITSEEIFTSEEGLKIAKLFIRNPIWDHANQPSFDLDNLSLFHRFLTVKQPEEFSNSFLVVAGFSEESVLEKINPGILWSGNSDRLSEFGKERVVIRSENKFKLLTMKTSSKIFDKKEIQNVAKAKDVIVGENLEDWMIENFRNKSLEDSLEIFKFWLNLAVTEKMNNQYEFDFLPRNFVRNSENKWEFVDDEWILSKPVSNDFIFIRGLYYLFSERLLILNIPKYENSMTFSELVQKIGIKLGLQINPFEIEQAIDFMSEISAQVTGNPEKMFKEPITRFFEQSMAESKKRFQPLLTRIESYELNSKIVNLVNENQLLEEKLIEKNNKIKFITNSISWKITKPLRILRNPRKYL